MTDIERARAAIDAAHAAAPRGGSPGGGETLYADRVEQWIGRLAAPVSLALRLAARAQHIERWAIPRADFPEGRGGYLRWRSAVHRRQGDRVREILSAAGCEATLADRVAVLVAKAAPREDAEAQALEDAACLVFLEHELLDFAAQHPREKTIDVLRKTWRKMSPAGHAAAQALTLAPEAQALVGEALA